MKSLGIESALLRSEGDYCLASGEISKGQFLHVDLVRNLVLLILDLKSTTIFFAISNTGVHVSCNMGADYELVVKATCIRPFRLTQNSALEIGASGDAWSFPGYATIIISRQLNLRSGTMLRSDLNYDYISSRVISSWMKMDFNKTVYSFHSDKKSMTMYLAKDSPIVTQHRLSFC
jgi:hypothetical protein